MNKTICDAMDVVNRRRAPHTLYHYCPNSTLKNIIKSKELWLGNIAYMNDTQELNYFVNRLKLCLQNTFSNDKLDRYNEVLEKMDSGLSKENRHVFCLSELYDDAAQWERYANNACGVSVGFNSTFLVASVYNPLFLFGKVAYGNDPRNHAVYKVLREYIETGELTEGFSSSNSIISNVLICATQYKHDSFSSEHEWRISTSLSNRMNEQSCPDFHQDSKLIKGSIKDVVVVNLKDRCSQLKITFDDLFDNIIIGPRSKKSVEELQGYLKKLGHDKLAEKVYKSTCPLR